MTLRNLLRGLALIPTKRFLEGLRSRLTAPGAWWDPRAFIRAFLGSPHYRPADQAGRHRIAMVDGLAIVYRLGGPGGFHIVLTGILPRSMNLSPLQRMPAPESETAAESDGTLIPIWRLITRPIIAPREKTSYRGVTEAHRRWAQDTYQRYLNQINARRAALGWPSLAPVPVHVGHITPHVFARPGERILVRPEEARVNLGDAPRIAAAARARRALKNPSLYVRPRRTR